MSCSTAEPIVAAVLTVSDSCSRGEKQDLSGPAVEHALEQHGFRIVARALVPDDLVKIQEELVSLCGSVRLVATTGGSGVAPRDVTPEATHAVCDRLVEGIPELMRAAGLRKTPYAALSRAVCGIRGTSLILNLPGSPSGAVASFEAVVPVLRHALDLLAGKTNHPE